MRGASTVNGLHGMYLHHRLNSSRLVVLLQQWTRDDGARAAQLPQPDVAQGAGLNWDTIGASLKREGRLHLETY